MTVNELIEALNAINAQFPDMINADVYFDHEEGYRSLSLITRLDRRFDTVTKEFIVELV